MPKILTYIGLAVLILILVFIVVKKNMSPVGSTSTMQSKRLEPKEVPPIVARTAKGPIKLEVFQNDGKGKPRIQATDFTTGALKWQIYPDRVLYDLNLNLETDVQEAFLTDVVVMGDTVIAVDERGTQSRINVFTGEFITTPDKTLAQSFLDERRNAIGLAEKAMLTKDKAYVLVNVSKDVKNSSLWYIGYDLPHTLDRQEDMTVDIGTGKVTFNPVSKG